ncbi:conserved hypothetical protein [Paenibacillus curdlanolyticus YK9]|uniref:Methyltransferase n=1 Tax=Paenibacillus curdlanolyticus YK9 TaxID=717606 RepID=E0I539_9BACL|nr:hypothetical protein [Paenibacillus curdlanolyticus]EFM12081.1 conserved hypothetical protein [Paenibacillus curdlanolyticus YK9]
MSRSWERKVRNNMNQLNKQRKKQGIQAVVPNAERSDIYKGRSFIGPILLLLIVAAYALLDGTAQASQSNLYWVTIGCYILLAVVMLIRRPYLKVGQDYVQTRKFTGDRRLRADEMKAINVQDGYIVIERHRGGNWVFARITNRYPTTLMAERLKSFAQQNQVPYNVK